MIGLLVIGLALILGVTMRMAASAGVAMLVLMWSAVLPPANNPLMDDRINYALVIVAIALANAGQTWGSGAHTTDCHSCAVSARCADRWVELTTA